MIYEGMGFFWKELSIKEKFESLKLPTLNSRITGSETNLCKLATSSWEKIHFKFQYSLLRDTWKTIALLHQMIKAVS